MTTTTAETRDQQRRKPRAAAPAAAVPKLHDFGQLGFGMDVVDVRPTYPLIEFTYSKGRTFNFNGEILLPDQFVSWDPTPKGKMVDGHFSGVLTTAREYQRTLSGRFGMGAPVDGIEFSGEAEASNERFTRSSTRTVRMLVEKLASYEFLSIRRIDFADALTEGVRQALAEVGDDERAIQRFFDLYGTHVISQAGIGGHMHLETRLQVTADVNREVTENGIDLSGQAKAEDSAYIKGAIGFHDRFEKNSEVFLKNSSTEIQLLGGEVTAADVKAWTKSLEQSQIPTLGTVSAVRRVGRHGSVGYFLDAGRQYLGLVNPKLQPIYEVLGLSKADQAVWEKAMKRYFGNVSPFDDTPQRFTVDHLGSALREGDEATFKMGGWHETWEDHVGFEALPTATTIVRVTTNSPGDTDTEKKIYAGQTTQVREKTPYWGNKYFIKVLSIQGDPKGVVYARAKKVPW